MPLLTNFLSRQCAGWFVWVVFAVSGSPHAVAAPGIVKGQVEFIRTHDAGQLPTWAPPRFWFSLKGITHAGSCPLWNGTVLFVANDKQQLSLVVAAQASGQEIAIAFDDLVLANSWCASSYITIGNPAPLY